MGAGFFYRTYLKLSQRSRNLRLSVTPFGLFTSAVCLISGLTGINVFSSELYKLFSLTFAALLVAYFNRDRKGKALKDISAGIFLEGRYNAGSRYKYTVRLHNGSSREINGIKIIPVIGKTIPSVDEFISLPEPEEQKRNIWDRNIYYFRWVWHMFRLHKAEFSSVNTGALGKGENSAFEGEFRAVKRGVTELEGLYLVQKNVFGLFSSFRFIEIKEKFYIYPAPAVIASDITGRIKLNIRKRTGSRSNILKKFKAGEFVGLRDYVPGDPVKNIHWKTWAKRDKPAVIEKGTETVKEIAFLLVNLSDGYKDHLLFDDCVSYLYSLINKFEADNFEVSLYFFDNTGSVKLIHADKETGNFNKLYKTLAEVEIHIFNRENLISKAAKLIEITNILVFSPETDKVIEDFCRSYMLDLFSPVQSMSKDRSIFEIPVINVENYQINLP